MPLLVVKQGIGMRSKTSHTTTARAFGGLHFMDKQKLDPHAIEGGMNV